jgi:penicillin-binding protein 1C
VARKAVKTNATPAQTLVKKTLFLIKGSLALIGKPVFYLLFVITAIALFLLSSLRRLVRAVLKIQVRRPRPSRLGLRALLGIFIILALAFSFWSAVLRGLPSPQSLVTRSVEVSTKIYDRNGVLLYKIYKDENRTPITLAQVPLFVRQATLAAEDAEFYNHLGFSLRGILRALVRNIKKGELSGGSTITQQLVKNALLSPEKTILRKMKEIILSVEVEATFTKDEILEMYLNEVSYGGTAYGIQEASRLYFGKDVDKLTLGEAALLAGLPKSPTKFSPFGSNPELAFARQREVLELMAVNGYITKTEAQKEIAKEIVFAPNRIDIKAPHFVMLVRQQLVEKYGEELVAKGGLEVITTLDSSIQTLAEKIVAQEVRNLSQLRVGNGAALVLNPQTGEILAMVGSKDYFDTEADGNVNITTSLRQPGSSIKVINYAYALGHGYSLASILDDSPVTFSVSGLPPYSPKNYDGRYRGRISLRSALAESRNIPAVKVLASYGVGKMIDLGVQMGISTWGNPANYGLSLTLGGGEIKLIDLARVYATIANYGRRPDIKSILKILDGRGGILEENECDGTCSGENVLDPRIAYLLIDTLKDNLARTPAFGALSALVIPGHPEVAVKTGTSNDLKDNLTLGFNQKYLVATWVGNNDNTPMSRIASGVTGASPIFNKIMTALLANDKSVAWDIPQGLDKVTICPLTGTLPCAGCPTRTEWFLKSTAPQKACLPEQFIKKEEPKADGQILEPAAATIEVLN